MAVIEYGDADALSDGEAQALFDALEKLSAQDPWFAGWGNFRAKALVRAALLPATLDAVLDTARAPRLRLMLARQFQDERLEPCALLKLRQLALDAGAFYALREDVAKALIGNLSVSQMRVFVEELRCQGSHDATRLAAQMILLTGIDFFEDEQVVVTIYAACGHSISAVPSEVKHSMAARTWSFRKGIPDARLDSILDLLADYANALLPKHRCLESSDIINLGDALISRRLALGDVPPSRLLHWLRAFSGRDSYVAEDEKAISSYLRDQHELRRAIQADWFAGKTEDEDFFKASYKLARIHQGLAFTDADLAAFLTHAPTDFEAWRIAIGLVRHSDTEGADTRAASRRFRRQ